MASVTEGGLVLESGPETIVNSDAFILVVEIVFISRIVELILIHIHL
jgi:hypothetical protein